MRVTTTILVCLSLAACAAPPEASPPPANDDDVVATVALDDGFVRRVLDKRCFSTPPDVAAVNPSLNDDAWAARLLAFDTTAVQSDHVVLDDEAIAACVAALDGDDCLVVQERCLPMSRFFVGSLDGGAACGTRFDCQGACIFSGGDCGVCAECASNEGCDDGDVCIDGTCQAPGGAGAACVVGLDQCADGLVCAEQRCATVRQAGEACDDGPCAAGLICGPDVICEAPRPDDAVCTDDTHCASGLCAEVFCAPLPTTGACADGRCGSGARCDDDVCVPAAVGDACESAADCDVDHACGDGTCRAPLAPGDVCTAQFFGECGRDAGCFINDTGGPFRCRLFEGRVSLNARCEGALCAEGVCAADRDGEERCLELTIGRQSGDACSAVAVATCPYPLVCSTSSETCVAPTVVDVGGACDAERVCRDELLGVRCDAGVCTPRGAEGDACALVARRRDGSFDDNCDANTTICGGDGVCVRADDGATCDFSCLPGLVCGAEGVCADADVVISTCASEE